MPSDAIGPPADIRPWYGLPDEWGAWTLLELCSPRRRSAAVGFHPRGAPAAPGRGVPDKTIVGREGARAAGAKIAEPRTRAPRTKRAVPENLHEGPRTALLVTRGPRDWGY